MPSMLTQGRKIWIKFRLHPGACVRDPKALYLLPLVILVQFKVWHSFAIDFLQSFTLKYEVIEPNAN